jgi:hypothetical protein
MAVERPEIRIASRNADGLTESSLGIAEALFSPDQDVASVYS